MREKAGEFVLDCALKSSKKVVSSLRVSHVVCWKSKTSVQVHHTMHRKKNGRQTSRVIHLSAQKDTQNVWHVVTCLHFPATVLESRVASTFFQKITKKPYTKYNLGQSSRQVFENTIFFKVSFPQVNFPPEDIFTVINFKIKHLAPLSSKNHAIPLLADATSLSPLKKSTKPCH